MVNALSMAGMTIDSVEAATVYRSAKLSDALGKGVK